METLESHNRQEKQEIDQNQIKVRQAFRILGPLRKLHNIIVYIRSSPGRTEEFKSLTERTIPLNNRTRWNSWYDILKVALKMENHVDAYTKNYITSLRNDYLILSDWERLRTITTFLKPFKRAILALEEDRSSIDSVLFTIDVLVKIFKTALTRHVSDSALTSRIRNSWQTFDKYYSKTDKSPLYAAALILYPNYRIAYIEVNWKKKWIKPALKKVTKLWESYREKTAVSITVSPQSKVSERDSEPDEFD